MRDLHAGRADRGFTLLEVLAAMAILFVTASGLIHLFVVGISLVTDARDETVATLLAMQKIEALRFASGASPAMAPSPANALEVNVPGSSELVDAHGQPISTSGPPATAVYLRRWAVRPLNSVSGPRTLIQVLVTTPRREGDSTRGPRRQRDHADALLSILRKAQ